MYNFGGFSTDPKLWPFIFEFHFAKKWLKNGGIKAVLTNGPVTRDDDNHVSTYSAGAIPAGVSKSIPPAVVFAIVLSAIVLATLIGVGIYAAVRDKKRA